MKIDPRTPLLTLCAFLAGLAGLLGQEAVSDAPAKARRTLPPGRHFLRLVKEGEASQLQTSIVRYRNADGAVCDLIAAVHVGEKSYYETLNKRFREYDALLYELVSDGQPPPAPGTAKARPSGGVSGLQMWMKRGLALQFQLEAIDYTVKNFVHADMDPETFLERSRERGESLLALMMRSMKQEMARQGQGQSTPQISLLDLVRIFTKKDRSLEFKRVMARQIQDLDSANELLEGEDGSVLVSERNKVAIEVLKRSLEEGKRHLGIFYGAAHMPDLEWRMVEELGFERTGVEWIVAWDMTGKENPGKLLPRERF